MCKQNTEAVHCISGVSPVCAQGMLFYLCKDSGMSRGKLAVSLKSGVKSYMPETQIPRLQQERGQQLHDRIFTVVTIADCTESLPSEKTLCPAHLTIAQLSCQSTNLGTEKLQRVQNTAHVCFCWVAKYGSAYVQVYAERVIGP